MKETDYGNEAKIEEGFLHYLDRAVRIRFRSTTFGTDAVFEHQRMEDWFSLHGSLAEGQQVVLPTGELSTLTNASGEFSFDARFPMSGEIVLKGMPVVHRGSRAISVEETKVAFEALASMSQHAAIATVVDGLIESVRSPHPGPNPFCDSLEDLFRNDRRYRKVHEIGFGTNRLCASLEPTNFFPNERYPGVHFGLGLGGYTPFHHDLVCTEIDVLAELDTGELIDVHKALGLR